MQVIHQDTTKSNSFLLEANDCPDQKRLLFRATTMNDKAGFAIQYEHLDGALQALHQGNDHPSLTDCPDWAKRYVLRYLTSLQESPVMERSISYQLDTLREQQDTILERLDQTPSQKTPSLFDALEIVTNSAKRGAASILGFGKRLLKTAAVLSIFVVIVGLVCGGILYAEHPEVFAFTATVADYTPSPETAPDITPGGRGVYTVDCEPTFLGGFLLGYETEKVTFVDGGDSWYRGLGLAEVNDLEEAILDEAQARYFDREAVREALNTKAPVTETVPVESATSPIETLTEETVVDESPVEEETTETGMGE